MSDNGKQFTDRFGKGVEVLGEAGAVEPLHDAVLAADLVEPASQSGLKCYAMVVRSPYCQVNPWLCVR